jgi:iron-sulfur cluster insertion protein
VALTLTENAARRITTLIKEDQSAIPKMFRVMVSGGGCSGFQYGFSLEDVRHEDDQVFERCGITLVVDEASLPFLDGVEIDYVEELIGASFQVKNPNASSSCGCGSSFSIA